MSKVRDQSEFAGDVARLIIYIHDNAFMCSLGEAYRTPEQAEIYAKSGKGIKDSLHIQRLAIDINLFDQHGMLITNSNDYEQFGKYWESLNPRNRWGGYFVSKYGGKIVDGNHFERKI